MNPEQIARQILELVGVTFNEGERSTNPPHRAKYALLRSITGYVTSGDVAAIHTSLQNRGAYRNNPQVELQIDRLASVPAGTGRDNSPDTGRPGYPSGDTGATWIPSGDTEPEIAIDYAPEGPGGPADTGSRGRNIDPTTGRPYLPSDADDGSNTDPATGDGGGYGSEFNDVFNQPWFKSLDQATQGLVAQTIIQSSDALLQDPTGRVGSSAGVLNPDGSFNSDFATYLARRGQTEASGGAINPSGLFNRALGDQQGRLASISGSNGIRDADGNVDQDFVNYLLGKGRIDASGGVVNPDGSLNDRFADFNTGQNYIGATEGLVDSAGALNPDVANFRTGLGYIDQSQGVLDRRGALNPDFANYNLGQNYIASSEGVLDREGGINPDLANYNIGRDYIGVGKGALDAQGRLNPDFADYDLDRITRGASGGLSDQDVIAALRQSESIDNPYALAWGWTNPLPENDFVPPWRQEGYEAHTPDPVERNFVPSPASQNYIPPRQVQTYRPARFAEKTFNQPPARGNNFKVEHLPESNVSEVPVQPPTMPTPSGETDSWIDRLLASERESEGGISNNLPPTNATPPEVAVTYGIHESGMGETDRSALPKPVRKQPAGNPVPLGIQNYRDASTYDSFDVGGGGAPSGGSGGLVSSAKPNPAVGNGGRNGLGPVDPSANAAMRRIRDLLNRRKYGIHETGRGAKPPVPVTYGIHGSGR